MPSFMLPLNVGLLTLLSIMHFYLVALWWMAYTPDSSGSRAGQAPALSLWSGPGSLLFATGLSTHWWIEGYAGHLVRVGMMCCGLFLLLGGFIAGRGQLAELLIRMRRTDVSTTREENSPLVSENGDVDMTTGSTIETWEAKSTPEKESVLLQKR